MDLNEQLEKFERLAIETALACSNGIISHAAKSLGINRTTLIMKMKRLEIDADEFRDDDVSEVETFTRKKPSIGVAPESSLRLHMIEHVVSVLKTNDWNRTHAAAELGIALRTLRNLVNEAIGLGYCIPKTTAHQRYDCVSK